MKRNSVYTEIIVKLMQTQFGKKKKSIELEDMYKFHRG